jgi:AcrR family transcriptional regulator
MSKEGEGQATATAPVGDAPVDTRERGRLSRERIVRTALQIMDEEGLEAVTMRRVGRELGVEAMSLYNHVRDKEDLLDGVSEVVVAEFRWQPDTDDWVQQGREVAHEWRRLVKAHPNVIRLMMERKHPLASADALRPTEIALDILRRAGLSERDTAHAFHAIGGYIFGSVMMEIGHLAPGRLDPTGEVTPAEMMRSIPPGFPCLQQMLPWFMGCDADATFELGLDLLLEGIRAKAASGA